MKFCEKLLNLRKQKGWSQEELGDKLEVSRQTISKWESGQTTPELEKLRMLGKIFEITVDELINEDEEYKDINNKEINSDVVVKSKIKNERSKKKIIFLIMLLVVIIVYVSIVCIRLDIVTKMTNKIDRVFFESFNEFSMKKTTVTNILSPEDEDIDMLNSRVEYYCYSDELSQKQKTIYYKNYSADPYKILYSTENYNMDTGESEYITTEINLEDKTYKKYDEQLENINNCKTLIIYTEWNNMFNPTRFLKNRLILAMDFRIKIYKIKDVYYISNYDKAEPQNEDSCSITIDMEKNKIILEKITHDDNKKYDFTRERYELTNSQKIGDKGVEYTQVVSPEQVKVPDLSEYTLIED